MRCCALTLFVAALLMNGCDARRSPQTCVSGRYGFEEWTVHPELLAKAVARADAILDPALKLHLVPSASKAAREGTATVSEVYGTFVSEADVAEVAGSCVFVNHDWKREMEPFFASDTSAALDLEAGDALAIILLHEMGHIQKAALPDDPAIATLIASLGPSKREEMRADVFAARQIVAASKRPWGPDLDPYRLEMALSKIGWNLQADRMLNHFGATTMRSRTVFGDKGESHPNLELRFLVIGYLVHPDPTSLRLLEGFLDARTHSGGVLYQQNPAEPYSLLPPGSTLK